MSGYPGDLSPQQEEALHQFRKILEEVFEGTKTHPMGDADLCRFLRARQFLPDKARDMYLDMLAWRKSFGVEKLRHDFHFPEYPQVKHLYPHGTHKTDKGGRPVYIERIGALDIDGLMTVTTLERLVKLHVREWEILIHEKFPACTAQSGTLIYQQIAILDLKGLSMRQFSTSARTFVQTIAHIDQQNYPEHLHRMIIVNAPVIFKGIFKMLKPLLDKRTQNKIMVLGSDYATTLLQLVDPENLPDFLGGLCRCPEGCLHSDAGPWKDHVKHNPNSNHHVALPEKTDKT